MSLIDKFGKKFIEEPVERAKARRADNKRMKQVEKSAFAMAYSRERKRLAEERGRSKALRKAKPLSQRLSGTASGFVGAYKKASKGYRGFQSGGKGGPFDFQPFYAEKKSPKKRKKGKSKRSRSGQRSIVIKY